MTKLWLSVAKKATAICVVLAVIWLPCSFVSKSYEAYKNVLIYRAINSDTAEKAQKTINRLFDLVDKKISDYEQQSEK